MKKVVAVIVSIVLLIFLVGCVNYKTQSASEQNSEESSEESRLIDEIAKIEQELRSEKNPAEPKKELPEATEEVEEEVVLPKLNEEPVGDSADKDSTDKVTANNEEMQVIEVDENEIVKLNVKVNDPDQDSVEYSFTSPLNKAGQWKTNYGDAGEYIVTLTATDGKLATERQLKIIVNRVNVAPVVSGIVDLHVKEGEVINFKPVVSDLNGDKVTLTVSAPLQDKSWTTDYTSAGEYEVTVVASDGELKTEKTFTLLVDDVNEPPVLSNLQDLVVKEGEVVTVLPKVSDLDGDNVTVAISKPVGDSGIWKTSYTDHGEYLVTVTVSDGKDVVTKNIKLVVNDVNMPPEIVEVKLAVN